MINADIDIWAKWSKFVDKPNTDRKKVIVDTEEKCKITEFFKQNPDQKMCMISCSCHKCRVHC